MKANPFPSNLLEAWPGSGVDLQYFTHAYTSIASSLNTYVIMIETYTSMKFFMSSFENNPMKIE